MSDSKFQRSVVVRMDDALYNDLADDADCNERTVSQTIRHILKRPRYERLIEPLWCRQHHALVPTELASGSYPSTCPFVANITATTTPCPLTPLYIAPREEGKQ